MKTLAHSLASSVKVTDAYDFLKEVNEAFIAEISALPNGHFPCPVAKHLKSVLPDDDKVVALLVRNGVVSVKSDAGDIYEMDDFCHIEFYAIIESLVGNEVEFICDEE